MMSDWITWFIGGDRAVFTWINSGCANPVFDALLPWVRERWVWAPLYVFILAFNLLNWGWKKGGIAFLLLVASVGAADFTSSTLVKKNVQRLRPCNDPQMEVVLRIDHCGSGYSFTSSHAANHFAAAVFLAGWLGPLRRWIRPALFTWAFLIAFSQVYVGVHFPLDVTVGAMIGALFGRLGLLLSERLGKRLALSCLLFSFGAATGYAQSATDSLWRVWTDATRHDTLRLNAVDALSRALVKNHPDSAFALSKAALRLAQEKGHVKAQARALTQIGMSWRFRSDFPQSIQAYEQSIYLLEKLKDTAALADACRAISDVYRLQSNFSPSIQYVQRSLALAEAIRDPIRMADAYVCFSTIYYMSSDNLEQVENYLLKAKSLYESGKKESGLEFVYSNLSLVEYERKNYPKALEYIRKCLDLQSQKSDWFGMATSLQNRATIFTELGRFAEAQADYEQEIAIFKKIGDQEGLSDAYSSIGGLMLRQNKAAEALPWCEKALMAAKALGEVNLSVQYACQCLFETYEQKGDFASAFSYLKQYAEIKDSLQSSQTERQLQQMEMERDSLSRAKTALEEKQSYDRALREKNRTLWILMAFLALGALAAWAFWTRMLYFKRRSLDMQIRTETMQKQQLLNEIALLKTQVNPHFLFNSLSILSSLVHKSPELSEQFIEQLARSYRYILEQKDQVLVSLGTELEFIQSYAFLLKIRFDNKFDLDIQIPPATLEQYQIAPLTLQLLVENAVKHNRMSGKEPLVVSVYKKGAYLEVRNPFRPRGEQAPSTGIGLKNIIERYALLSEQPVKADRQADDFVVRIPLIKTGKKGDV